jgi:hypothetical protein
MSTNEPASTDQPQTPDPNRIFHGLGVRTADDTFVAISDDIDPTQIPDGAMMFASEVPPYVAYEIGWSLAMYAKSLHEYAVTDTPENETTEAIVNKASMLLTLAELYRDWSVKGLRLQGVGDDLPLYDVSFDIEDNPEVHEEANES